MYVDGPDSKMVFKQFDFGGANQLFCVTNGGYVKGRIFVDQNSGRTETNNVVRISGAGSVWDHDNGASGTQKAMIFQNASNVSDANPLNDFLLHVTDGGVLTNFAGEVGCRGSNAKILIDGGSLYTMKTGANRDVAIGTTKVMSGSELVSFPTNCVVEVTNGGKYFGNVGPNASGDYRAALIVGGDGSNCRFLVNKGGEANTDVLYVGTINTTDPAIMDVCGRDNEVIVGEAGRLVVSNLLEIGTRATYGTAYSPARNCALRVRGAGAELFLPDTKKGANWISSFTIMGQNCGLEVSDGGVVTNETNNSGISLYSTAWINATRGGEIRMKRWIIIGRGTSTNAYCSVTDGGKIIIGNNEITIGDAQQKAVINGVPQQKYGNTLFVGDGGMTDTLRLRMYGYGNRMVVSNGLVKINGERFMSVYGMNEAYGSASEFVFEGSSPQLNARGAQFGLGASLTFRVPKGGYTRAPIYTTTNEGVKIDSTCTIDIDIERDLNGHETMLMECSTGKIEIDEGVMAALVAKLPPEASLRLTEDKKKLFLKVAGRRGTVLTIR